MAVSETPDDTKGVNNMLYVILSLVVGGVLTSSFSIMIGKDMIRDTKMGFKPSIIDIILFTISTYEGLSLFGLAIYCLI